MSRVPPRRGAVSLDLSNRYFAVEETSVAELVAAAGRGAYGPEAFGQSALGPDPDESDVEAAVEAESPKNSRQMS